MLALPPVTTDSSPITVGEGVEDPTMEGIVGTWATGTKTGLEAMLEDRIGGTKVHHAATPKSLYFFVWLILHKLTSFVL